MFRKIRAVDPEERRPVVIANATEGEPASDKDKVLLVQAPHLVLDGLAVAAQLIGAQRAILVVPDAVGSAVGTALAERRGRRWHEVPVELVRAAKGFVAGEASAVVNWVDHGIALPRMTPPRLTQQGLGKRPTLVHNVETLAQLALLARHGAEWFAAVGPPEEPGTMLVTMCGALRRPGVFEVAIGTPIEDLLDLAGGPIDGVQAILVGGYSGTWVAGSDIGTCRLSRLGLRERGATPGAGVVGVLGRSHCGLIETARVIRYLADQSAGQCGPCVYGLDAIACEFHRLATSGAGDLNLLERWMGQVDGRGACSHPDGAVHLVRSALRVFEVEVSLHHAAWCTATSTLPLLPTPGR